VLCSGEVIYYFEGNFMSRRAIDRYDISLHPSGLLLGPQPGTRRRAPERRRGLCS
jgi:homogentisate 1,2-dioxygenase